MPEKTKSDDITQEIKKKKPTSHFDLYSFQSTSSDQPILNIKQIKKTAAPSYFGSTFHCGGTVWSCCIDNTIEFLYDKND